MTDEALETMKDEVVKLLMADHDMSIEDAEELVEDSVSDSGNLWNENAEARDLANFLASDENA
jgi:hypothetical protein